MASNPVVDLLAKQSTAKLRTMQGDIQQQINDLMLQAQWIKRAIEEKGGTRTTADVPADAESRLTAPIRRNTGTNAAIRQVIEGGDPERVWLPGEVVREVKARGITSSAAAIRVALRRMGEGGLLARGPNGEGWKLASVNGSSASEPSTGAPSVGLGGMDGATSWPPNDRSGAQAAPNQSGYTS
jgi:hypothetical protein